ncbi:hypothetical protein [Sphingomonas endolithica]|uniref:hypothetical protein n=1 Tax=Sphingomonas endolithica TaxID=2972485 RepID=UPI0021AEA26C|nr:hypothetical protein [Sphingomonas sp. ZFBP2030]
MKERMIAELATVRKDRGIGIDRTSALTPDKLDTARKLVVTGDKPAKVAKLKIGVETGTPL